MENNPLNDKNSVNGEEKPNQRTRSLIEQIKR